MQNTYLNLTGSEWSTLGGGVFGGVTNYFSSQQQADARKAEANALIKQGLSQVEVAKIMQETERMKLEALKSGGNTNQAGNKTLYIGLGIGALVILGLVVFAVTRKK